MNKEEFATEVVSKVKAVLKGYFEQEDIESDQTITEIEDVYHLFTDIADLAEAVFTAPNGCIVLHGHFGGYRPKEDKPTGLDVTVEDTQDNRMLLAELPYGRVIVRSMTESERIAYAKESAPKEESKDHPGQMTIDDVPAESEEPFEAEDLRAGTQFEGDSRVNVNGYFMDEHVEHWPVDMPKKLNMAVELLVVNAAPDDYRFGIRADAATTSEMVDKESTIYLPVTIESQSFKTKDEALAAAVATLRDWASANGDFSELGAFAAADLRQFEKALDKWLKENGIEKIETELKAEEDTTADVGV